MNNNKRNAGELEITDEVVFVKGISDGYYLFNCEKCGRPSRLMVVVDNEPHFLCSIFCRGEEK